MLRFLFVRELVFLAVLTLIGSGFAAQLRRDLPGFVRWTLAPGFGLAAAMALLVTVNFFVPLRHAFWFALLPLGIASAAWAVWTERRRGTRLPSLRRRSLGLDLAVAATLLVAALLVLNRPLDGRFSTGPVAYGIFDAPNYVNYAEGFQRFTNDKPFSDILYPFLQRRYDREAWGRAWNLTQRMGWGYKWQHASSSTVPAALAGPFGWPPWQLQSAYSLVLVMIAALGAAGLARAVVPTRRWPSLLAGLAGGGPLLFQLWVDGAQGLISGVALVPAFLVAAWQLVARPTLGRAALCGLVLAGISAGYAEVFPQAVGTLGLLGLGQVVAARTERRGAALRLLGFGALALVFAVLLSPRSAIWLGEAVGRQLGDAQALIAITPRGLYDMSIRGLPAWLTQTREFYDIAFLRPGGAWFTIVGIGLPLALLAGFAVAALRLPRARILLAWAVVACAQSLYSSVSLDCSYCVQRTLLTLAPVAAAGVWVGLYALTVLHGGRLGRLARGGGAFVLAGLAIAATASTMRVVVERAGEAVMAEPQMRSAMDAVSRVDGTITLEGFGSVPYESWAELPMWYQAASESTSRRLSTPAAYNDYAGFWYTQVRPPGHPAYTPDYSYVLTRTAGLDSGRRVIYRQGPFALARRASPFDVAVARGVVVDTARRDPLGIPWVQRPNNRISLHAGPLTFWVSALSPRPVRLAMVLGGPPGLRVLAPGVRQRPFPLGRVLACMPVRGRGRLRIATARVLPVPPEMGPPLAPPYDPVPSPAKTVSLQAVRATGGTCAEAARELRRSLAS